MASSTSCRMVQSLGICFSNNPSLCKSQREQMPGSCSLRACDRLKENVQLETAAVSGAPPWGKPEDRLRGRDWPGRQQSWSVPAETWSCRRNVWVYRAHQLGLPQHKVTTPPSISYCRRAHVTTGEGEKSRDPVVIMDKITRQTIIMMTVKHMLVLYLREFLTNVQEECELSGRLTFLAIKVLLE